MSAVVGEPKQRRRKKLSGGDLPPLVIGCDPSSRKLAFYITQVHKDEGTPLVFTLRGEKDIYTAHSAAAAMEVCDKALSVAEQYITPGMRSYLFIEEPVVAKGGVRSSLVQAYINGTVQGCFVRAGFTVDIIHVSTWKSSLGIPVTGGKPQVLASMEKLYPLDVAICDGDGDLLDAAALARFGCQALQ